MKEKRSKYILSLSLHNMSTYSGFFLTELKENDLPRLCKFNLKKGETNEITKPKLSSCIVFLQKKSKVGQEKTKEDTNPWKLVIGIGVIHADFICSTQKTAIQITCNPNETENFKFHLENGPTSDDEWLELKIVEEFKHVDPNSSGMCSIM